MANGCIRVYSGLMDMMNDNEVEGVLGHEMGHVALGHTRKAMQVAYSATAARSAISSLGGVSATLSQSQLADLGEKYVNAQFSQKQESEADDYSFDLLKNAASIQRVWRPALRNWQNSIRAAVLAGLTITLLQKPVQNIFASALPLANNIKKEMHDQVHLFYYFIKHFLKIP